MTVDTHKKGKSKGKAQTEDVTMEDPDGQLVDDFQTAVNATRRAEQKVRQLTQTRERKEAQFSAYMEELKKSYLKEYTKYRRAQDKLSEDMQQALQAQEEARHNLRNMALRQQLPKEPSSEESQWEEMTRAWHQQRQEEQDAAAVLQRAMQGPRPPRPEGPVANPAPARKLSIEALNLLAEHGIHVPPGLTPTATGPLPGSDAVLHGGTTGPVGPPAYSAMSPTPPTPRPMHPAEGPLPTERAAAKATPPHPGEARPAETTAPPVSDTATGGGPTPARRSQQDSNLRQRQPVKQLPQGVVHVTSPSRDIATKLERRRERDRAMQATPIAEPGSQGRPPTGSVHTLVNDDTDEELAQDDAEGLAGLE